MSDKVEKNEVKEENAADVVKNEAEAVKSSEKKTQENIKELQKKLDEKKKEKLEEKKEGLKDSEVIDLDKETSKEKTSSKTKERASYDLIASKKKKKKKIRKIIILCIVAAALIGGFFYIRSKVIAAKALVEAMVNNVQTVEVERKTLLDTVPATGTLIPRDSVTLSTILQSSSKIEEVNVEVGDYVEEGDVLVRFSTEDISKQISDTQEDIANQRQQDAIDREENERQYVQAYVNTANSLRSAAENVDKKLEALHEACSEYGDAKRQLQEDRDNGASETIIRSDENIVEQKYQQQKQALEAYDSAVEEQAKMINGAENDGYSSTIGVASGLSAADLKYKKSQVTADNTVKKLQRQLRSYEDSLDNYIVTASISGTVTDVNVSEGNSFANGSVLTIQDMSAMEVEVLVDEYDIPKVKKAYENAQNRGEELEVEIKTNATEDNMYKGHVVMINPTSTSSATFGTSTTTSSGLTSAASSSSSSPQYKVKVLLDEKDDAFMIGMTAKVSIVVDQSPENSLCVPYNAISENDDGEFIVQVVENQDKKDDESQDGNGIVVENNTSKMGKGSKDSMPFQMSDDLQEKLKGAKNIEDATKAIEDSKPKTREVKVRKIFETDYYIAIEPINANELKEGDSVVINDDRGSGNDLMNMMMMSGPGGPR